jgi:cyclophilin family peptidyl-prolyl cis-trans isomerase
VSPNARNRAREKRRNKKRQSVLALRAMESRRNRQALGIVLIIIVVIGGLVALSLVLNKDDKTGASGKAPQTVASFLSLAKSGYWADSPCHRLTTEGIFVLQCGDPTGTGGGSPGYGYGVENPPADFAFAPGTLAMARTSDPKSNGQLFIVHKQTVLKDPAGYSIFGKITSGMDIVERVAAAGAKPADTNQNTAPLQPISILAVNVTEKKA